MPRPLISTPGLRNLESVIPKYDKFVENLQSLGFKGLAHEMAALNMYLKQASIQLADDIKQTQELKADTLRAIYKAGKYGSAKPKH